MKDNKNEIENEGLRLHQLQEILAEFMKHARKSQVDIATSMISWNVRYCSGWIYAIDIQVTDFSIAIEVVGSGEPSPASGVSANAYSALDKGKEFIVWLLEPMRPAKQPKKWSGTMQHPDHNSKVGDTLTSFVHFAYQWTEKGVVFADLQSKFYLSLH